MLVIFLLIIEGGLVHGQAFAQDQQTWETKIDGVPVWVTIIHAKGSNDYKIPANCQQWWECGNTETDTYLFAINTSDDVRIILAFSPLSHGNLEAKLYLNQLGKARLDYQVVGDLVSIQNNGGFPYLTIRSHGGGWQSQGSTNYNLTLLVDGYFQDGFGDPTAKTDGKIDTQVEVHSEKPGIPAWQTTQLLYDPHPGWGYPRYRFYQRLPNAPDFRASPPFLPGFPYFTISGKRINWYEENPNPLFFSLAKSQLFLFPFPGFENGGMYNINSLSEPPNVDFEAPFIFYNFDPHNRYSQLALRASYFGPDDSNNQITESRTSKLSIRYSWKTNNEQNWSYSLQYAGSYMFNQEISVGNTKIYGISANQLPDWIMKKNWPITTFVEAPENYSGSEGIYFYGGNSTETWNWLDNPWENPPQYLVQPYLPQTTELTDNSGASLPAGFRGEYQLDPDHPTKLYFSPVDNLIHLLGAEGGLWNLGSGIILREQNLDGGDFIDSWEKERILSSPSSQEVNQQQKPSIIEAIYTVGKWLIYTGPQGVELINSNYSPSTFKILPPFDRTSWLSFVGKVTPYTSHKKDPTRLKSWLNSFGGESFSISKSRISDFRITTNGFRFLLNLRPGFRETGSNSLNLNGLQPGSYIVEHSNTFKIALATNPNVALQIGFLPDEIAVGNLVSLQIDAVNSGMIDTNELYLIVTATHQGKSHEIRQWQVDLLSNEPVVKGIQWQPLQTGDWTIKAWIEDANDTVLSRSQDSFIVKNNSNGSPLSVLLSTVFEAPYALLILLASTASMIALIVVKFCFR